MAERSLVTFDWAIKRILRSKANFAVLEGFLTSLLGERVKILALLESESNQENIDDKYNRVDLKVENSRREIILIEIQNNSQKTFFMRMLYSASKAICEHIHKGDGYDRVVKVISINILYFSLGSGDDYVYKGRTDFRGIHTDSRLKLSKDQAEVFMKDFPGDLMPEYYVIDITGFNDVAKTPLDEWIYFLKNEVIREDFEAPGLREACSILDVMKLSKPEREEFDRYLDYRRRAKDSMETAHERGRAEGRAEGILDMAKKMKGEGLPVETIARLSGLAEIEVEKL